jgi:hypothetical protein
MQHVCTICKQTFGIAAADATMILPWINSLLLSALEKVPERSAVVPLLQIMGIVLHSLTSDLTSLLPQHDVIYSEVMISTNLPDLGAICGAASRLST